MAMRSKSEGMHLAACPTNGSVDTETIPPVKTIFTPRSNSALALGLGAVLGLLVGLPTLAILLARTPYITGQGREVEQPILFDHRHHVRDDGIDCRYCHDLAEVSPVAGIPSTERCLNCHSQIWNDSARLAPIWESRARGVPLVWRRVHRLPDFVYFNHSAHLRAGVGCFTCHGAVDRMARVHQARALTMEWCVGCHENPAPHLRPRELLTAMVPDPVARPASLSGSGEPARAGTDCTTCHR